MFPRQIVSILLLATASLCAANAPQHRAGKNPQPAFAEKIEIPGLSDAGKINEFLYRGSQPNENGIEELHKLGVTLIVDLRGEFKGTRENERREAERFGIRLISIPGNGWSPPTDKQIAQFLSLFQEHPRQRIYVHCWFGGDRSGVFLATYRITFDHWTPQRAVKEMKAFHFKSFWHPAMRRYVKEFPQRLKQSPEFARFRNAASER
jgi:tyrosine-protein phosphatase SIW14